METSYKGDRYHVLGQSTYRFEGYKSSILKFLLSNRWRLARFIAAKNKGFTSDDEYGTLASGQVSGSIWVSGSEVGQSANDVIVDTIRGAAMGAVGGLGSGAILQGFNTGMDAISAMQTVNDVAGISDKLTDMSGDIKKPNKVMSFMDHRFNKRIIIDVSLHMSQGHSKFSSKRIDTGLEELNCSQLAAIVSGLP